MCENLLGEMSYLEMVVDHSASITPPVYQCVRCKGINRKLWLDAATSLGSDASLMCTECAEADEKRFRGSWWQSARRKGQAQRIGRYSPAIPRDDDSGYYPEDSVPRDKREWWRSLRVNPGGVQSV